MNKLRLLPLAVFCLLCAHSWAWEYYTSDGYPATTTQTLVQMRVGADFQKKWHNGLRLHLSEDLRFDMFNSLNDISSYKSFNKSYTTLSIGYAPISYFRVDAGYMLKIMGTKDWSDHNEWLRHRVFLGVTGSYKFDNWKLSLRERAMLEIRTDSVNPLEKNQYDWTLRSRLTLEYSCRTQPLKPYVWVELANTLNAPEYQKKYANNDSQNKGHQYITKVHSAVGLKWRLDKQNTLNFFYRFNYDYDRDINIKRKDTSVIRLTEERSFQHAIGVAYEFGM